MTEKHRAERVIVDLEDSIRLYGEEYEPELYVGMKTERFDSEDDAIEAGIKLWKELELGGTLYLGLNLYLDDDREILAREDVPFSWDDFDELKEAQ